MLKQTITSITTFMITVFTASIVGGSFFFFITKIRITNYTKEQIRLHKSPIWIDTIINTFFFTCFALLIYYAAKKVISLKYKLNLFKLCIIGCFSSLGSILIPLRITGYNPTFDIKAWLILFTFSLLNGTSIALTATILDNFFNHNTKSSVNSTTLIQ